MSFFREFHKSYLSKRAQHIHWHPGRLGSILLTTKGAHGPFPSKCCACFLLQMSSSSDVNLASNWARDLIVLVLLCLVVVILLYHVSLKFCKIRGLMDYFLSDGDKFETESTMSEGEAPVRLIDGTNRLKWNDLRGLPYDTKFDSTSPRSRGHVLAKGCLHKRITRSGMKKFIQGKYIWVIRRCTLYESGLFILKNTKVSIHFPNQCNNSIHLTALFSSCIPHRRLS